MKPYAEMTKEELVALRKELKAQYREMQGKDLKLDMSRGKPCVEQLDLSMGLMDVLSSNEGTAGRHDGSEPFHGYPVRQLQPERHV